MRNIFFILFIFLNITMEATTINYKISVLNPNTHYANVELEISDFASKTLEFKMPVWTPGSYMVREFEKNVDRVTASNEKGAIEISKTDKSTWKISDTKGSKKIVISYPIYCFEASVRTSYIDSEHAFFLLTSCLMYSEGMTANGGSITLDYPKTWQKISTTLSLSKPNVYNYANYDELVDSPIEIGNHTEISFTVQGVPHKAALVGLNNCPIEKFTTDITKICETMSAIVGKHPCKEYLFVIHHLEEGGGGLEHANSCVVQIPRFNYTKPDKYISFLGLLAHEYFHLWNVKRIRPIALNPFDYSKENYTNLLWVAEGITSYYDELALYRAGFWTKTQYLDLLAGGFNSTQNRIGAKVQCLHEASFDAWIKEYRPTENSINSNISYYTKGAIIAAILDMEIVSATNGSKHLDDLMQYLYNEFYIKQNRGFTDKEFYESINVVAGKPIDMNEWVLNTNNESTFNKWNAVLDKIGLSLENKPNTSVTYTGINLELKGEKQLVKSVDANSPAIQAGLQAGDELISINNLRVKLNFEELIKTQFQLYDSKSTFEIIYSRAGIVYKTIISATLSPKVNYSIKELKPNELLEKFLRK